MNQQQWLIDQAMPPDTVAIEQKADRTQGSITLFQKTRARKLVK